MTLQLCVLDPAHPGRPLKDQYPRATSSLPPVPVSQPLPPLLRWSSLQFQPPLEVAGACLKWPFCQSVLEDLTGYLGNRLSFCCGPLFQRCSQWRICPNAQCHTHVYKCRTNARCGQAKPHNISCPYGTAPVRKVVTKITQNGRRHVQEALVTALTTDDRYQLVDAPALRQ